MARRVTTTDPAMVEVPKADAPEQQFLRLMSHEMRTPLNG